MGKYKEEHGKTRIGNFLNETAPHILNAVADVFPDKGVLGVIKNLIDKDTTIKPEDKETALKLLDLDIIEAQEVTKRWSADMSSDSWLSKNVRPLTLMFLILFTCSMIFIDSKTEWAFELNPSYIMLLQTLLVTVIVAYFGSRGMEKYKKISVVK